MARKRKRPVEDIEQELAAARDEGWTIIKFSPIHYRITMEGMKTVVDIWPTAKKIWRHGSGKRSRVYDDLVTALASEFSHEA